MQGGTKVQPRSVLGTPGGTRYPRGVAVVREGEWRHEEVAPGHERRRDGEAGRDEVTTQQTLCYRRIS
jgi:hypothetical protein